MKKVRTRFAPSPTGYLHVGGARTALFNYLYAKAKGGDFIIRIEDTDQERSTPESEKMILDSLTWLGIHSDEGPVEGGPYAPYRQSERLAVYNRYTQTLIDNGAAYPCFCRDDELEKKQSQSKVLGVPHVYDGKCRALSKDEAKKRIDAGESYAIRFKTGTGEIVVNDHVQGRVKFDARLIGDFIIVKSDGFPSYNYAVVIDDYEMKISHVIRGVGHLSNTPRQILIHEALNLPLPEYSHISEIVGTDKKKLSKRRGATSVLFFKELGYISEAFVNYMALLGWYPEDGAEFMPDGELAKKFDIDRCSKSPAMFDFFLTDKNAAEDDAFNPSAMTREELSKFINKKTKLNWLNNKYIRHLPVDEVWPLAVPFIHSDASLSSLLKKDESKIKHTFTTLRIYLDTLDEIVPYMKEVFKENIQVNTEEAKALLEEIAPAVIDTFIKLIGDKKPVSPEDFSELMKETGSITGAKGKSLFMTIRIASTGSMQGLELPTLFAILGVQEVTKRMKQIRASV